MSRPSGIRSPLKTRKETVDHRHRQPKTVRLSESPDGVLRTTHYPEVPEQEWLGSSQLIDPESQQRDKVDAKEQVRQDWLRRLRPRRFSGSGADHGRDNARGN